MDTHEAMGGGLHRKHTDSTHNAHIGREETGVQGYTRAQRGTQRAHRAHTRNIKGHTGGTIPRGHTKNIKNVNRRHIRSRHGAHRCTPGMHDGDGVDWLLDCIMHVWLVSDNRFCGEKEGP